MIAIQTTMETIADIFEDKRTLPWPPELIWCLNIDLWKISTLNAATINRNIFSQKVGSVPNVSALVINNSIPDGIMRNKPRCDQGSKWRDKPCMERLLEHPKRRKSNIKAAPTKITIPIMCTISKAGYNHRDWRMPDAQVVCSNQRRNSAKNKGTP